jgi:hypothetical protein
MESSIGQAKLRNMFPNINCHTYFARIKSSGPGVQGGMKTGKVAILDGEPGER